MKVPVIVALTSIACLLTSAAHAAGDAAPKTGFVTMIDQGQQWLKAATAGPTAASDPTQPSHGEPTANRAEQSTPTAAETPHPFLSLVPNASVVARDWRGSLQVVGAHSMLIDDVRPTASNRMVLGRLASEGDRLSLFTQLGVGQWRVDTVMFPNALADEAIAAQAGAGFELRLTAHMRLAGEIDHTMLYRNLHYPEGETAPRMTSLVVAFAGTF